MKPWTWCLLAAFACPPLHASDYWQCTDPVAIARGPEALEQALGADAARCRRSNVRGVDTLNCELARPRVAFGLSALEVSASVQAGGTRRLTLVFKVGEARVRKAVEQVLGVVFERDIGGWLAIAEDDVQRRFRVLERDDGATQFACEVPGEAAAVLNAAIIGRLTYEGAGRVSTRVCAIPVDESLPLRCVELPPRIRRFRIDDLAGADYYLAAYPLEDNPEGVIAAYGRTLRDCSAAPAGCVAALLVPLKLSAGMSLDDVHIGQRFAAVPARVARVREGR
ncbi:MAG: hypothetical protein IT479_02195 [Xanthomonadales bacterium]|nr:hypothetical protein [Xanthomonadales bacterium]MCC6592061.1 hypothetical protein [Xanthomonadales bacterium]MCE7932203.1 hypothetical protein [Xanthomonadales bacterium PRO6]